MDWVFLVASLLIILVAAELFTNGIEWVGEGFGLSEGAVGSVLAAIGTALPETLLPIVAIVSGHEAGDEIGIGAILGAPFMLTTLAMVAGLLHVRTIDVCLAIVLVVGYAYYVRRHFQSPQPENEGGGNDIRPLRLWVVLRMGVHRLPAWTVERSTAAPFVQVAIGLILMVGGAKLFVDAVGNLGKAAGLPPLAFSLLVAPLATELPEKFNSVLWVRRNKDTLAMGNMTGAMVFQSAFPVTVGLLLTPWELAHEALVAACVALLAGSVLYMTLRIRGRLSASLLLLQGVFYVGYVAYVVTRL